MESYERKMNLIKSGALALEDIKSYDPLQDLQSHSKSMKRAPAQTERCVAYLKKKLSLMSLQLLIQNAGGGASRYSTAASTGMSITFLQTIIMFDFGYCRSVR